ncbi:MAG: 50S ribosomal protein L17 [Anaerolineaceae bacterium]|nr:50S ribosomal protein L17 [Anaerolineaceae bacterium]MCY3936620.1 50S ribosomal protein L17 [Chloroflexota bacterium]MCY4009353.1 50S ribosomal protein L17 [Anaerolineaceae bacterium]MCY4106306.1 50S ribosomal protein L17 [Chloroflexota bacterium]
MRHRKQGKRLGRDAGHRRALQKNLTLALFEHGRIRTTLSRARFARGGVEKLITLARRALAQEDEGRRVHAQRLAARRLGNDRKAVQRLFNEIAPRFADRPGGYTRILKLGPRRGDNAEMALLELVEQEED